MSKPSQKKTKYIHDVKGPAVLTADIIADIVDNRPLKGGRKILADKYGISEKRVLNIWKDYYGGTTLKDHAGGLKKPLPTTEIKTADITTRKFKSERGLYTAKEPKIMDKPDAKAKSVRRVAPQRKVAVGADLDLDNIAEMTDAQAKIINGEVLSGNNSPELLQAIASLIESNHNITERMVKSLEATLAKIPHGNFSDDYYSDSDNIDDDDSTAVNSTKNRKPAKKPKARAVRTRCEPEPQYEEYESDEDGGYAEPDQSYRSTSNGGRTADPIYSPDMGRVHGNMGHDQRHSVQPTRPGDRARAIYRTERSISSGGRLEEADIVSDSRYESQIPPTKYNPSKASVQPNNTHNDNKQYPKPTQGERIPGQGGVGFGQAVPGISWLQKRRV